mgnify:CR=1 FL=1
MNAPVAQSGRIGPNAITRLAEALRADLGERRAACVFGAAGLGAYLVHPPDHMVDEAEVGRLHWALREALPVAQAERLSRIAGDRTADYLLAHRIPKPVQRLLRLLPAPFASDSCFGPSDVTRGRSPAAAVSRPLPTTRAAWSSPTIRCAAVCDVERRSATTTLRPSSACSGRSCTSAHGSWRPRARPAVPRHACSRSRGSLTCHPAAQATVSSRALGGIPNRR